MYPSYRWLEAEMALTYHVAVVWMKDSRAQRGYRDQKLGL